MTAAVVARPNTQRVAWGIGILAGIVAMIVFAIIEMAFSWAMRGTSPLQPLVVFGTATLHALMPPAHVGGGARTAIAGAACLLALGAVSGVILAYIVDRIGVGAAALAGAIFGLAMYAIDMHGVARLLPALADLRDWMSALAYVIQGALTAALFKVMTREEATVVDNAPDLRDLRHVPLM